MYNWQQKGWTKFTYQIEGFEDQRYLFTEKIKRGQSTAFIKSLPDKTYRRTFDYHRKWLYFNSRRRGTEI